MNQKSNLIIPDADVVIHLVKMSVWDRFLDLNQVYLSKTVLEQEVQFCETDSYHLQSKEYIDLSKDVNTGRIHMVSLAVTDILPLQSEFSKMKAPQIELGEIETIAAVYLEYEPGLRACLIERAAITCAVLAGLEEKCLSVEVALSKCGLSRTLPQPLTEKRFRSIVSQAKVTRVQYLNTSHK